MKWNTDEQKSTEIYLLGGWGFWIHCSVCIMVFSLSHTYRSPHFSVSSFLKTPCSFSYWQRDERQAVMSEKGIGVHVFIGYMTMSSYGVVLKIVDHLSPPPHTHITQSVYYPETITILGHLNIISLYINEKNPSKCYLQSSVTWLRVKVLPERHQTLNPILKEIA